MTGLPQPFYNPQITPTSTFAQPFTPAPTPVQVQLGQGLEDIGPAFMNFSQTLASFVGRQASIKKEEDIKSGQAKLMASRKTFRQLVDSGKIDPATNPWEAYGAAQADAVMSARSFSSQLQADYEAEAARNPAMLESVDSFDTFANERIRQAASQGIQNPIWVNTFLSEIDPDVARLSKDHVVSVGQLRRKKMSDGLTIGMAADIGTMMRDIGNTPILEKAYDETKPFDFATFYRRTNDSFVTEAHKKIQERIDEVAQTIGGETANSIAVEAIMDLRLQYGDDPRITSVAERIKTPGGQLTKTERYKAAEAARANQIETARNRMTIEKRQEVRDYIGSFFDPGRIRNMPGQDILEGKGFPSWSEVEGQVRKMNVSAELYEDIRQNFEQMKSSVIQERAADVVYGMGTEMGATIGQQYAEVARKASNAAAANNSTELSNARGEMARLAQRMDIDSIAEEAENQIRLMKRAYKLKDADLPKTIDRDHLRRAVLESVYYSIPREPNSGLPTQDGLVTLIQAGRAVNAKYIPSVTPLMRTAVEAWNQPNADATQIPREVELAVNLYMTAKRANEVEMLGLPESSRNFLDAVDTLLSAGTGRTDAFRRANMLTSGSSRTIALKEPTREEVSAAAAEWNDSGSWFGNAVSPAATGMGQVEQAIRDSALVNQLNGAGSAEALAQAKAFVNNNAIVFEGTVILAPSTTDVLGRNPEAWGAARDEAVRRINERLKASGSSAQPISPDKITWSPRSLGRDNVYYDLVYKDDGSSLDVRYRGESEAPDAIFSYSIKEMSDIVSERNKSSYRDRQQNWGNAMKSWSQNYHP